MRSMFRILTVSAAVVVAATVLVAGAALSRPFFDPRSERIDAIDADPHFAAMPPDAACSTAKLVSTGGPTPRNPHTLAVRWTGFSNFELAYRDKIILLDAFIDRGSNYPPLGFAAADVKRADVIVIGHAHFDHMSDAASIALRTGALVVGAPVTTEKLASQSVPAGANPHGDGKGRGGAPVRRLHHRADFGASRPAGPSHHRSHGRRPQFDRAQAYAGAGGGRKGDPRARHIRSAHHPGRHHRLSHHPR